MPPKCLTGAALLVLLAVFSPPAQGRFFGFGSDSSQVNFPYTVNDDAGDNWFIDGQGTIRQQMGQPIYAQGALLSINGAYFNAMNNTGKLDSKTGELVLENQIGPVSVTRYILVDKTQNFVRYVDVFHNPAAQEVTINAQVQSNFMYGIPSSSLVADPKAKKNLIGWVGMTPFGRAAAEMFGGKGSKNPPQIASQMGNNVVTASWSIKIPGGKDAAIMHLHLIAASTDAGTQFMQTIKETTLMRSLPVKLRQMVINFPVEDDLIGDIEILRGDIFDIVELRDGDQLHGTLGETDFKLDTFYGPLDLPVAHVVAMINTGQFRTRQLMVLSDGEIFGGRLEKSDIGIELTSGQTVQIPLDQISRFGYRRQVDEPEEWTFDQPMVLMRSGDRVQVQMPTQLISVNTRYGLLNLDPRQIASILFQNDTSGIQQMVMTDGSQLGVIVTAPALQLKLGGQAGSQVVTFPTDGMLRLQLMGKVADIDDSTPVITMANGDTLCGSLSGPIKLDTSFDTLTLDASQIRAMERTGDAGDLRITLGDGTVATGQIRDSAIACRLLCGTDLMAPVSLISQYDQPSPQPAEQTLEQIRKAVANLSADDWHQRDAAQATLTSLGPVVVGVLRQMRDNQPDEAKQRIDAILRSIDESSKSADNSPAAQ
ncbi:MAG TPA: hypothetical protein VMD30_13515 [Tepidisphaeraceae bacterium]|nr:hypothetical protein [Tepidisphaeraceae bacterium]